MDSILNFAIRGLLYTDKLIAVRLAADQARKHGIDTLPEGIRDLAGLHQYVENEIRERRKTRPLFGSQDPGTCATDAEYVAARILQRFSLGQYHMDPSEIASNYRKELEVLSHRISQERGLDQDAAWMAMIKENADRFIEHLEEVETFRKGRDSRKSQGLEFAVDIYCSELSNAIDCVARDYEKDMNNGLLPRAIYLITQCLKDLPFSREIYGEQINLHFDYQKDAAVLLGRILMIDKRTTAQVLEQEVKLHTQALMLTNPAFAGHHPIAESSALDSYLVIELDKLRNMPSALPRD